MRLFFLIILTGVSDSSHTTEKPFSHHGNKQNGIHLSNLKSSDNDFGSTFSEAPKQNESQNNDDKNDARGEKNKNLNSSTASHNTTTSLEADFDSTLEISVISKRNISLSHFDRLEPLQSMSSTDVHQNHSKFVIREEDLHHPPIVAESAIESEVILEKDESPTSSLLFANKINPTHPYNDEIALQKLVNINSEGEKFTSSTHLLEQESLPNEGRIIELSSDDNLSGEYRLIEHLLGKYNKHVRPVEKSGHITNVVIKLSLFNVLKMDTKHEVLKTNAEIVTKWMDVNFVWDPSKYNNISVINLPYEEVWTPDIILYNTAESDYDASILRTNVIVHSNGEVRLVSHTIFASICNVDTQWYPFDQQNCEMYFASWTHDRTQIQLILGHTGISEYNSNPEFSLENFSAEQHETLNPCCKYPMSAIVYKIQLQRRTKFSVFFYLMPGILINICALMVFSLPIESGEKITLGINSLLTMIVFLMAMTENLPPTEKIPLSGLYYGVCLSLVTADIVLSVFVLNLSVFGDRGRKVPGWLRQFVVMVAKRLRFIFPEEVHDEWGLDEENNYKKGTIVKPFKQDLIKPELTVKSDYQPVKGGYAELKDAFERRTIFALETLANQSMREEMNRMEEKKKNTLRVQWKFISRVFDRTLFLSFFVIVFVFNVTILTSSPFAEKHQHCPLDETWKCDGMTKEERMSLANKIALEDEKF